MSDEMFIEGKSYISSKKAAQLSGYAQDYIGQLARKDLIEAQRVGGLWYVAIGSLEDYQKKAAAFKPEPPVVREQKKEPSTLVFFDGKEYISASRAAELTGYVQDYVGQLARTGQILSRQVGNRWYVEKDSIQSHKQEKDGLLAAVQSQAVGLQHFANTESTAAKDAKALAAPTYTYAPDSSDLLPVIQRVDNPSHKVSHISDVSESTLHSTTIPIRKSDPRPVTPPRFTVKSAPKSAVITPKQQVQLLPLALGTAATIVIVLSVGYASTLKQSSLYAAAPMHVSFSQNLTASVTDAFNKIADIIEPFVTREIVYHRSSIE